MLLLTSLLPLISLHHFIHCCCGSPIDNETIRLMAEIDGKKIDGLVAYDFGVPISINGQFRLLTKLSNNVDGHHHHHNIIQPLNAFFERFFAGEESMDKAEWDSALPTDLERAQMKKLILFLYQLDHFGPISSNSTFLVQFAPLLAKSIQLTFIQDRFCIVHERLPASPSGHFRRHWGYLVLASPAHSSRPNLHHSSPHFQSDGDVCNEAAAIFERTGSRSLVISGASRFSVRGKFQSPCQPKNALADAAHNNATMFHTMCAALLEANAGNGGEGKEEATFLQWHGMAESSCAASSAFLSVGAKRTHPIYANGSAVVNRLVSAVNALSDRKTASTPAEDKSCRLVASTNVFGRIVNGVPASQCCRTLAKAKNVRGQFVHVEQKRELRDNWDLWANAINGVFPRSKLDQMEFYQIEIDK